MRLLFSASIRAGYRVGATTTTSTTSFKTTTTSIPPHLCLKSFSTSTEPLIRITTIPAPSTGQIRILSLNRPNARNAISRALLTQLHDAIDDIHKEYTTDGAELSVNSKKKSGANLPGPTRAVVIASEVDSCFCAGADLKERAGYTPEETQAFLALLRQTFTNISTLPIPTISAISSLALGGGLELALCTHFRVVSPNALLGLPETRIAIIPGAGGTYRLPSLIGIGRARDMILTGRRVGAEEAEMWGLVDRVVDTGEGNGGVDLAIAREETLKGAVELAEGICTGGPVAIRAALAAVQGWHGGEKVENAMYERVVGTEDRNEALKAFREKRVPLFKGR